MANDLQEALRTDTDVTNDASQDQASLAGIPGFGTLQVVRGHNGETLEVIGTWRLIDDQEGTSTERLNRACEAGETVVYEGKFDDPAHPEKSHIKTDVRITSVRNYAFDQKEYAGENATEKTLYGFTPEADLSSER